MLLVPMDVVRISYHYNVGRKGQHSQRIAHRFVIRAVDRDFLVLNAISIAVLAKEQAIAEAFLYAWNVWRYVEDACCQQHLLGEIRIPAAPQMKAATLANRCVDNFVLDQIDIKALSLLAASLKQILSGNSIRETQIV